MAKQAGGFEKRRETRIPLSALTQTFIGARMNEFLKFQYLLIDASPHGAQIALPESEIFTSAPKLALGDDIHFFLPLLVGDLVVRYGKIVWLKRDESIPEHTCGASLDGVYPSGEFFQVRLEKEGEYVFLQPLKMPDFRKFVVDHLKDSSRLKKEIVRALDKILPILASATLAPETHAALKSIRLSEIRPEIDEQAARLEKCAVDIALTEDPITGVAQFLDLQELRPIFDAEMYQGLFTIHFDLIAVRAVIEEMKKAEQRLYFNYNSMVLAAVLIIE